jgi:hypothetical protein
LLKRAMDWPRKTRTAQKKPEPFSRRSD